MNLIEIGLKFPGMRIPEGYKNNALVDERRHAIENRSLLPSAEGASGYERSSVLARERPLHPDVASFVPESLCG